ncbi:hypothetical protein SODALDRAFT_342136 [Sodiomyces alkalinus F11]|uniref:Mid2 domain-containing protein n=1 Tax=Sodiomyces alkalinus (strain CBS 110278 / VKM F-3762 / F11) TaxID=1314773 RepID=A0A3N2Q7Y6_SODAK|nr:hypothetical protein SODALDRAFT_342136 [Sodiomyces alkalinus F11]ROT42889.1 hypothetical protein SODALDRAFT_342136 [Sodiomyces alkalinus F11]
MLARNDLRLLLALPPATALLVLSNLLAHANAHALPRQTTTVPYRELDVLPYPPLPTAAPLSPFERLKRQEENTICGYISGDPDLPATCSAGSHCVVAQGLGVIGCCPNGDGPCTAGIFTGCVDANSGPQTEVNPYIYSCTGSDVCYRNVFAGGNFQYGCGSASNIGGTVAATASGRSIALPIPSVSAPLTASPSFLSRATILGTISRSGDDTSTTPSADPSTEAPDASTSGGVNKTGAIIGGSVSGAAVLLGVLAVVFFWRRRRQNKREGPGLSKTTHYISNPMGGGPDFAPVAPSQEAYDQGYASHGPYEHAPDCPLSRGLDAPFHHAADCPLAKAVPGSTLRSAFPAHPFTYGPGGEIVPTRGSGGIPIRNDSSGMFGVSRTADDQVPLNHDYQDFTRGFSDGLSRIDEEGSRPTTAAHGSSRNGFI